MIQNAILYVLRKKKRTCILFIILTTVLSFLYSSLNIMKLSNNLENDLYKISNTSISITQKDNQNFEINQFKEMENIQEIKEIIPQYDCLAKATNVEVVDGIQKVERENLPEILKNTFSIESTNSTKNNVLFNSGIFTIIDGRHIEKNDREKILIHEELAKKNNLKLHSKINLEQIVTEEINLEYITQYENNNELPLGVMQVIQEGRTGKQQITKKITVDQSGEKHEEEISSIIVRSPANKIVQVGTNKNKKEYKISKNSEVYVTSDSAEVKKENNYESSKITTLIRNTVLKVLEIEDDWCKIFYGGQYGWIKTENLASIYSNPNYNINQENKNIIYSFDMELNKPSGLTLEQFQKILTDDKDINSIFRDNAEYFYYIEKEYNINGVFVAAIGIHESAWGKSNIAKNKKNLFGYRAYDSDPYNSASTFNTYAEGIDLIARVLTKYYLNPKGTEIYNGETAVGTYYNGSTVTAVNKKYASDSGWANKVYSYMEYLYKKI